MSTPLHQRLHAELARREAAGTRRRLPAPPAPGLVDFSSNDYLGLSQHPRVRAALQQAAQLPAGSTGSRLLTGNSAAAEALETHLAQFHGTEAALLFNSGYTANLGFFSAVPQRGDTILYDEASHASVKEGIRASFAAAWSFRHNDLADLERKLSRATGAVFVAVEALYSMDGDMAPLAELAAFCGPRGLHLVVDEAHSNGVYGPRGAGLVTALGLEAAVFARILTFGKALGSQGAAVAGPAVLRDYLLSFSRPFIYTTALPPATIAGLAAAYELLPHPPRGTGATAGAVGASGSHAQRCAWSVRAGHQSHHPPPFSSPPAPVRPRCAPWPPPPSRPASTCAPSCRQRYRPAPSGCGSSCIRIIRRPKLTGWRRCWGSRVSGYRPTI